jgi:cytosine/adenosine deaminase-related metal-dependent hydrolase
VAGEIVPGAIANLVVWDLDHPTMWPEHAPFRTLAMGDTTQAIHTMFVMGRQVGKAGDFHRSLIQGEAYRAAVAEASERLARLLENA